MKDLNVRQETIKILEENTCSNLFDIGHRNFLLDTSPEARETKPKITPRLYGQLIIAKQERISNGKKDSLLKNVAGKTG